MDNYTFLSPISSPRVIVLLLLLSISSCALSPCGYYVANIPSEIDDASFFKNGLLTIITSDGQQFVIDTSGRYVFDYILDADNRIGYIIDKSSYTLLLVNDSGTPISDIHYDRIFGFDQGYAVVEINGKEGLIDIDGKYIIDPTYDAVSFFYNWPVPAKQNGKWGFLDSVGNIIIPFVYDDVKRFSCGVAAVRRSDKWGFIDSTGNLVIDYQYDMDNRFEPMGYPYIANNGRIIAIQGNKCGLIDTEGNVVLPFAADDILLDGNGVILIYNDFANESIYYLTDREGSWISSPYSFIANVSDSLYCVNAKGHYGLLKLGAGMISPAIYDYIDDNCRSGLIRVEKDGKYGFVDYLGRIVIPISYDWLGRFNEGLCAFIKRKQCGYMDEQGKQIIRMKGYYDYLNEFHEGYAKVRKDINQPCYFIRRKQ